MQNVDMGVAYSCMKHGVIINIIYYRLSAHGHENLNVDPFSFWGRVDKGCRIFVWIVTSVGTYVF